MRATGGVMVLALVLLPGCVAFSDRAGVPVPEAPLGLVEVGVTTRDEVLARFGPPTGVFATDLRDLLSPDGEVLEERSTRGRLDEQALTWQSIVIEGWVVFFPVLFAWNDSTILSTTFTVFFDEDGIVADAAYRRDRS